MALYLHLDPDDAAPLYRQLVRQVRAAVACGRLRNGDKLPSHRRLSRELEVNHLTVKQAYDTLAAEGILRRTRGRGTFVARGGDSALSGRSEAELRRAARGLAVSARLAGLSRNELVRMVREAWETEAGPGGGEP